MHNPHVTPLDNGDEWVLDADYTLTLNDGRIIFIPKGFIFDFASTPRITWRLFPPATGKHRIPALIHDWLVAAKTVSWEEAAKIFLQAMKQAGVSKIKRYTMYYAVRIWGYFHIPNHAVVSHWQELQRKRIRESQQIYTTHVI